MGLLSVTLHQLSKSANFTRDQLKRQPSSDSGVVPMAKWWSSWQAKYSTCIAIALGLTFLLSIVFITEQSTSNNSVLERVSASFKIRLQTEELPVPVPKCNVSQKGDELPRGMVVATSDLQMRSLYEQNEEEVMKAMMPRNLLAMAVGIQQKKDVDDIVQKFPLSNFTIMLFHYDGVVDQWQDLAWSNQSIHIVALHQTKWWFAKRFMHPSILNQYNYIFLWDEDLGVEHFNAQRYLEIMHAEGLEISQPALDPASQQIHHKLTLRRPHLAAHKSVITPTCSADNKAVPCTGYVEVMAPVFSKTAWRCVWHMIQNDLIHGWGIDLKVGYCAQGDRSEKVGIIDAEYVLHKGIPSLGGPNANTTTPAQEHASTTGEENGIRDPRREVRKKSSKELLAFQRRWAKAARDDPTWEDPYKAYAEAERYHSKARTPGKLDPAQPEMDQLLIHSDIMPSYSGASGRLL